MLDERQAGLKESYAQLGLKEGAPLDLVKSTYRALALRLHPDKQPSSSATVATQQFQALSEAYERIMEHILGGPVNVGGAGSGFGPPNGLYSFGKGRRGPARPSRSRTQEPQAQARSEEQPAR